MALVQFEVSDELARQIRGLIDSGRESRIAFYLRGRRVVSVSAENVWLNETTTLPRRYLPDAAACTRD